ncbi:carboxypeptidase M32 [Paenibacillus chartarius]|uniref:Metal-dependent carboxypeptidase n=1 Tax=Paenibacillus chartarius TaxID=747481 RepID=A0ABV6DQ06_9BACL
MSEWQQTKEQFRKYVKTMKSYEEAIGLLYWDMRTGAPKKGIPGRSEVVGELSDVHFRMSVSEQMGGFLDALTQPEANAQLDAVTRRMVEECKKDYDRNKKIPPELNQEYVVLTSKAEAVWEDAKHNDDFAMFLPYLEKIVEMNLQFIELWGYEGHKYNALLDLYEPGMTVAKLDEVFATVRARAVPLLQAIAASPYQPDRSFLAQTFAKEQQKAFSLFMLKEMGYDFEAGRLDETVHPFATGLSPNDVRITTRFLPDDVVSAVMATIHECGHALYEQNIGEELYGTNMAGGVSMGIHESQSRFWENMIGRSGAFWNRYYGDLQRHFPGQLDGVEAAAFVRAINHIEPSLIRIEADELTYNLHIMVRYEIEKGLFDGSMKVADLPEIWNSKYKEYLGIEPPTNALGVLQDVHWAGGSFGYFPSYSLGNMYAAQLLNTLEKQLPNVFELVEAGQLLPIKEWLADNIHKHGKLYQPSELIRRVTGEDLNPEYLLGYLENKYKSVYGL